ncbi:leucine-rich repeat-containing protein 15-like isoform X2 [Sitodiplosis mosellana]|uniref:leucine-rich repeat-containing protein 15-like isoform X2 n=1 Tax=Sitodiplosis mosellana TaxID=263140 RepID=UPI0024446EF2|nr:leucine-rich repeat-containing protein 15-like isoform X2 [Sitodiplosis mosellana]
MKTISFILIGFVIFQNILDFNVLCLSSEFVECRRPGSYDVEGKLTLKCSNDSHQIDLLNQNSYLSCSNSKQFNGYNYNVEKRRIKQVNIENCSMSKLTIKYDIFQQYTQLEVLNISYVGLESLEKETFEKAGSMIKLDASHNNIQDVPELLFLNAGNLNEIDFSYNKMERIDSHVLAGAKQLKTLDVSHNEIGSISGLVFGNALWLDHINLSHNKISVVEPNTFAVLKQLKRLDISHNEIKNISGLLFGNALWLEYIDLSYNEIVLIESKTFAVLKQLRTLDLSINNIKKLTKSLFDGLDNLQILSLNHLSNDTIEIEPSVFIGLDRLEQLYLGHNHIESLRMGVFEGLHNLQHLDLDKTIIDKLTKFAFSGIGLITELDLSRYRIFDSANQEYKSANNSRRITMLDKEAFDNLTNLNRLNLANNLIGTLNIGTFSKLENLQYLNLSNTNLAEIRLGTFSHTKQLETLDLSWNQLKNIDFGLFLPRYPLLLSLYLNENRLTDLEGFSYSLFPSLKVLGITGNNFNCSYLKVFLKEETWSGLTFVNDYWSPSNPHEMNIHGVKCDEVDGNRAKSTVVMFDASTTTSTTKTTTAIEYDVHDNVKFNQEKDKMICIL